MAPNKVLPNDNAQLYLTHRSLPAFSGSVYQSAIVHDMRKFPPNYMFQSVSGKLDQAKRGEVNRENMGG